VVTGDVTLEQAKALATQLLGSWKGNRMALPQPRAEAAEAQTPSTVLVNLPGAGQSGVVVMAPTVPYDSPERMVARWPARCWAAAIPPA
jgi:zinc protease